MDEFFPLILCITQQTLKQSKVRSKSEIAVTGSERAKLPTFIANDSIISVDEDR